MKHLTFSTINLQQLQPQYNEIHKTKKKYNSIYATTRIFFFIAKYVIHINIKNLNYVCFMSHSMILFSSQKYTKFNTRIKNIKIINYVIIHNKKKLDANFNVCEDLIKNIIFFLFYLFM